MKKALIVLAALASTVTGLEPAMATTSNNDSAATVSKQRHHGGWNRGRRVCTWQWRGHHRRVRVCRVVRWR